VYETSHNPPQNGAINKADNDDNSGGGDVGGILGAVQSD